MEAAKVEAVKEGVAMEVLGEREVVVGSEAADLVVVGMTAVSAMAKGLVRP